MTAGPRESRWPVSNASRDSLELASLASLASSSGRHNGEDDEGEAGSSNSRSSSPSGISSSRKASLENQDPFSDPIYEPTRSRHARSYSVSSAFDFGSNLFPLSQTVGGYVPLGGPSALSLDGNNGVIDGSLERRKTLTYLNGLSLIIGLSPGRVNANAGSPGASLIVWAVAGLLAWTGGASYAELGGAIPLNGGAQVYLAKIFGELIGFLFTWSAVFVLKPGSAAIISIIFGEYVVRAIVGADVEFISPWVNKGVAILGLLIITGLNCISTRLGTRIGDVFMFFKFLALLGVTIIGIVVATTGLSYKGEPEREWRTTGWFEGTSTDVSSWAVALYAGLWAFDGWDNTNYVTGEFKNPSRDLPRAIHTAMPAVILCYMLANISYFFVLPSSTINATNTVAVQFGGKVFGPIGALVLALVVSASCFGALNATAFTSGRLVYAAGREGYLPSIFGKIGIAGSAASAAGLRLRHRSWFREALIRVFGDDVGIGYTPIYAMMFNFTLTTIYISVGEFATLVTFYGVAGYTFYFLTVLGLIVLRIREPHLERAYKTWITTPIIFCCVSLFLLSRAVFAEPLQTLLVLGFNVAAVPVYFWRIRKRDGKNLLSVEAGWWKFWKRWGRS
ncbi:L-methionine porter [Histoplasma capsulatum]|uniref:L-methionine porter n=1 Tax=Ajellomyces capsulatus TaxID=5037 RepID=A0A8A1MEH6_AJECA|nr:L-methionine porter [Histoplasma capsulatum]